LPILLLMGHVHGTDAPCWQTPWSTRACASHAAVRINRPPVQIVREMALQIRTSCFTTEDLRIFVRAESATPSITYRTHMWSVAEDHELRAYMTPDCL